ncbi:MAG: glutamine--fructose-6-phosphate transaminase (isomerizing) [Candidatus Omnitrophica bacterium]|nr:glutamine--fructose-6-phosphate transaminase (isomerizing) [Candidatus Omnitrophota bacterium]
MCGIVGYIGARKALPVLIQGLEQLEYRGYDSAGVVCINPTNHSLFLAKEKGKLGQLKSVLNGVSLASTTGIAHTRWATHGAPSKANAHPHEDCKRRIALVHNGIIENYQEIKHKLLKKGHRFRSETDTEIAVHLIEEYYDGDVEQAFRKAVGELKGYFAFVVLSADEPGKLFVFKRSNPMVIGVGNGENFAASDVTAIIPYTRKVIYLEDDEFAVLERDSITISSRASHKPIRKTISEVKWSVDEAKKGGFPNFMLKEIYEQPRVAEETLAKRLKNGKVWFDTLDSKAEAHLKKIRKVFVVSCGTAYHAGLVGRYMLEEYAKVPTEVQVSSEFRYVDPLVTKEDLVILITQSGETADTIAALREARAKGACTLAIVNVVGSTIAREADYVIYTHAGPEIGVASTKAYIAQLLTFALFTIYLACLRKTVSAGFVASYLKEMRKLPKAITTILHREKLLEPPAKTLFKNKNFLFLGRGYNFPTALEGALKLKEISYAHAHGYAAGEMKHGPIALIDSTQPVICIAPFSKTYEKMVSNIQEIKARKAIVLSITTEGDKSVKQLSDWVFPIPKMSEIFSSILSVIPLQLFAYKISVKNHRDVDQPRNLAKSVTVE